MPSSGMDLSKMTLEEVQALLRLLAEFEREEMELIMREMRAAEQEKWTPIFGQSLKCILLPHPVA